MDMNQWAEKWGVSPMAMVELRLRALGDLSHTPTTTSTTPESVVQAGVRLEAAHKNGVLMRNNVGAFKPPHGGFVRYGLANETKEMNVNTKSSDLIGIIPRLITPEMIGRTLGVFTARECKREGWTYSGTDAEKAQLNFINLVNSLGGNACFASGEGTL